MTNFKNTVYFVSSTKQTVPASANGTGTIITSGKNVTGTGTSFKTEMPVGSWLVDLSQDEVRKVLEVLSDTEAILDHAFSVDLSSAAPNIIPSKDAKPVSIAIQIVSGSGNGLIDGEVMYDGTSVSFSKDSRPQTNFNDSVDPLILDAASTVAQVLIQY